MLFPYNKCIIFFNNDIDMIRIWSDKYSINILMTMKWNDSLRPDSGSIMAYNVLPFEMAWKL
jgi:hypothetical protein